MCMSERGRVIINYHAEMFTDTKTSVGAVRKSQLSIRCIFVCLLGVVLEPTPVLKLWSGSDQNRIGSDVIQFKIKTFN